MSVKEKKQRDLCIAPEERSSGTRDAVETAIDRAKSDKSSTWEAVNTRTSKRITRWQAHESVGGEGVRKTSKL